MNANLEVIQDGRAAVYPDYASSVIEVVPVDDGRTTVGALYPYMKLQIGVGGDDYPGVFNGTLAQESGEQM